MAEFKLTIGDPKAKRTFKAELSGADAEKLIGKLIGEKFKGELVGLAGYELEITGGSDNSGFPMRREISGGRRQKPLLSGGAGFTPKRKGQRKRKSVRGNAISADISQINCKIVKQGKALTPTAEKPKEAKTHKERAQEASLEELQKEGKKEETPTGSKQEKSKDDAQSKPSSAEPSKKDSALEKPAKENKNGESKQQGKASK